MRNSTCYNCNYSILDTDTGMYFDPEIEKMFCNSDCHDEHQVTEIEIAEDLYCGEDY